MISCTVASTAWIEEEHVRFEDKEIQRRYEELADNYYEFGLVDMGIIDPKFNPWVIVKTGECQPSSGRWRNVKKSRVRYRKHYNK